MRILWHPTSFAETGPKSPITLGEKYLHRAQGFDRIGRFQIEAAIQSVHCASATSGVTDWRALLKFHAALVTIAPTLG
ncbi:MAG: hypothetical protein ABI442_11440, partial [Gemmatimonadaceae bacterium]